MSIKPGQWIGGIRTIEDVRQRCYVDRITRCWHWRLSTSDGTPRAKLDGRCLSVRRWLLAQGKCPPTGRFAAVASCGNQDCVAPAHAVAMSDAQFMRWMVDSGRLQTPAHKLAIREAKRTGAQAKLDPAKVVQIVSRVRAGEDKDRIAADYDVSRNHVNRVARGKSWSEFAGNVGAWLA